MKRLANRAIAADGMHTRTQTDAASAYATAETLPRPTVQGQKWGWGPGFVFLLTAIGAQDLVSNSAAGAEFRYGLLWTLIPIVAVRYSILEASARYALVTGESLMAGYARAGRWLPWLLLFMIPAKRLLSGLYQLQILGQAIDLIMPMGLRGNPTVWAIASWAVGFSMIRWGGYRAVERTGAPFVMLLGGSIVLAALGSGADWSQALHGMFVPSLPKERGFYGFTLIVLALIGSGTASLSNLKYASFVRERGWRTSSFLTRQRLDLFSTGLLFLVMLSLLQVAAAATLGQNGTTLKDIDDLLPIFTTTLGAFGPAAFAVGVWTAVFTTFIGANTGYGMLVADIWHGVLKRGPARIAESASDTPAYRWAILIFCVPPLLVLFIPWNPVWLALLVAVALAALLPLVILVLLWLCNDRRLMGEHTNGWLSNTTLGLALIATLCLTWAGINELL
jgi:Mn2+/Fe2+ NRAMP family transporter